MPKLIPPPYAGRPRFEITDKVLKSIEESASFGLNQGQIAAVLGISRETFEIKLKENPNISLAIDRGLANSNKSVAASLLNNALPHKDLDREGKEILRPGQTEAAKFWLERKAGWREESIQMQFQAPALFAGDSKIMKGFEDGESGGGERVVDEVASDDTESKRDEV